MNIIVCIKQVPGSTQVKINQETGTLIRDSAEAILNPLDEYAVEEALRIREKTGGTVKALSMGPPQAEAVLKDAVAMGADEGFLISDPAFAGSDTWATAYTLQSAIRKTSPFDLIICGKQAIDGDTAQVGPGIAALLDIPFCAWVRKIETIGDSTISVQRLMEEEYDIVTLPLPALITVVKEINTPRMISLKGKMKAKKTEIKKFTVHDLDLDRSKIGLAGSPTQVLRSFVPAKKTGGEIVNGETPELVRKITATIMSLGVIK